ncbi:MAG: TraR/DksA family transcriptional regulator [Pseudomonadales bacterium]
MTALKTPQLAAFKIQLEELEQQLDKFLRLDEVTAETVELDQSKIGRLSRIDALQQQAMAQASSETHKQQLVNVHLALQRLGEGDYGYCEKCGGEIPLERLQVQPEAGYCVSCLQTLEENQ